MKNYNKKFKKSNQSWFTDQKCLYQKLATFNILLTIFTPLTTRLMANFLNSFTNERVWEWGKIIFKFYLKKLVMPRRSMETTSCLWPRFPINFRHFHEHFWVPSIFSWFYLSLFIKKFVDRLKPRELDNQKLLCVYFRQMFFLIGMLMWW